MLNTFICNLLDGKQEEKLHQTSISIAELILDFCKVNDIIPIFAFQSNSEDVEINTLIVKTLDKKAQHTLVYSIDYGNET